MTRSASTESTGGIGVSYERSVAACYLASMLSGTAGPGLKGKVVYVAAQQRAALDDLEIHTEGDSGQMAVARFQIKHQLALTASASNTNFASIVADAWKDLRASSFAQGFDRVGAVAERSSADNIYAARRLREMACLAASGDDLLKALTLPGQGGDAKILWNTVETLSASALSQQPTTNQLHLFWRHFIVVQIEASFDRDRDRAHAVEQLRAVTYLRGTPDPKSLFGTLELVAGTLNVRGAEFTSDRLRAYLAEHYDIVLEPADLQLEPITRNARVAAERDAAAWRRELDVQALAPEFVPLDQRDLHGDENTEINGAT